MSKSMNKPQAVQRPRPRPNPTPLPMPDPDPVPPSPEPNPGPEKEKGLPIPEEYTPPGDYFLHPAPFCWQAEWANPV